MTGRRKKGTGGCRLEGMCWIRTLREAVIFAQAAHSRGWLSSGPGCSQPFLTHLGG